MKKILSPTFWLQTMMSTLFTIFMIYVLKLIFGKFEVPVVSDVVQAA